LKNATTEDMWEGCRLKRGIWNQYYLNAVASGNVFSTARIAGGSAHVASRGVDAVAGEDTDTELKA